MDHTCDVLFRESVGDLNRLDWHINALVVFSLLGLIFFSYIRRRDYHLA